MNCMNVTNLNLVLQRRPRSQREEGVAVVEEEELLEDRQECGQAQEEGEEEEVEEEAEEHQVGAGRLKQRNEIFTSTDAL